MSDDDLKTGFGGIHGVQLQMPPESPSEFTKDVAAPASRRKAGPGRPPGLVNKLTREMQDAVLAAAEELGRVPYSKWPQEVEVEGVEDGMKQFYKALAVKELKTFGMILARMMPKFVHRTTTKKSVPTLLTEEQVLAELKEAGIPLDVIKHMHAVDITTVDTFQLDGDPYDDPEDDDDGEMVDVTPKDTAK